MQISIDLPKVKVKKSSAAPSLNIYKYNLYLFYGTFIDVEADCNVRLVYRTQQSIVIFYFIIRSHCCNWNKKTASSKV